MGTGGEAKPTHTLCHASFDGPASALALASSPLMTILQNPIERLRWLRLECGTTMNV
jgi:hypothetical protein